MRAFKVIAVWLVLLGVVPLAVAPAAGAQTGPQAAEEDKVPPLVRMDLLGLAPVPAAPPKRNIFSPRTGLSSRLEPVAPIGEVRAAGPPPVNPGEAAAVPPAQAEAGSTAAPAFSIDLRFIGFVESQRTRKIIGLVIFQGQALAVDEGEVISEGIRIGKIRREEIEVILPDSSTRTFSLEGEE
ncbi:MAG: hypothetical protein A2W03_05135 [Candidatus Aminicenantes bacterium RBG_16_63_16]|nr:MAG: hypothetical protein A2W03_05135 [Candidatus Aminicenantes bacterium RBG_16_63_16]